MGPDSDADVEADVREGDVACKISACEVKPEDEDACDADDANVVEPLVNQEV